MPIKHSYKDDTQTNPVIEDAYSVVSEFHFDLDRKTIIFSYDVYRDEEAYRNGREKIGTEVIKIDDSHYNAVYGDRVLISPGVEEVVNDQGIVVTPGVDPVFGDRILVKAAVPSFNEVLGANIPVYVALAKAIYDVALTQTTIFKDGVFVAPDKYELR